MKKISVFTAFSGYDSQCMSLERLCSSHADIEYELVGWSEIDPKAIVSHNIAFPESADRNYGDISKIDWATVPDFNLFTYSSPCQSFSAAGKREGGEEGSGTTSSLLWECRRAIEAKRPQICVFENVKGLVDKKMYHTFEDWQLTMCKLGYKNSWKVLNAADYGIPQHRERVFMVSTRIDDCDDRNEFEFPKPLEHIKKPVELLEKDVDEKYYLSNEECETYLDLLENSRPGYEVSTNFRGRKKSWMTDGTCTKQFLTPVCADGSISTLMASNTGTASSMYSVGNRPSPGVFEIKETTYNKQL